MKNPVLLMVEDNQDVLELNTKVLRRRGYDTLCAPTLKKAQALLEAHGVDLILLDIMLPDGSGLEFVQKIRAITQAPIIFLTCRREPQEIVQGLMQGGDDYMTKPYRIDELHARIVAMLRRRELMQKELNKGIPEQLTYGPLALDVIAQRATLDGEDMLLGPKEFAMLHLLIKHAGEVISKETLYEAVWNLPANEDTRAVWTNVSRLRNKLQKKRGVTLEMLRGEGYRLVLHEL